MWFYYWLRLHISYLEIISDWKVRPAHVNETCTRCGFFGLVSSESKYNIGIRKLFAPNEREKKRKSRHNLIFTHTYSRACATRTLKAMRGINYWKIRDISSWEVGFVEHSWHLLQEASKSISFPSNRTADVPRCYSCVVYHITSRRMVGDGVVEDRWGLCGHDGSPRVTLRWNVVQQVSSCCTWQAIACYIHVASGKVWTASMAGHTAYVFGQWSISRARKKKKGKRIDNRCNDYENSILFAMSGF